MPKRCRIVPPSRVEDRELVIPAGVTIDLREQEKPPQEGIFNRVRRAWGNLVREFTKHFPLLDNTEDGLIKDLLRQFESAAEAGELKAVNWVKEITKRMTVKEIAVFQRILWMRDMRRDFEDGRTNMEEMGYASVEQLDADIDAFESVARANPEIQYALERRQAIAKALTRRLVELKLLRPEVLEDDRYFHRQVLKHMESRRFLGLSARDVRQRKSGFQRARVQKLRQRAFNEDYFEAELEWLSQGATKVTRAEILQRIKEIVDRKSEHVRAAKLANEVLVQRITAEADPLAPDPYAPFRRKIAIANSQLARLASNGSLYPGYNGRYGHVVDDLREAYDMWKDLNRDLDPDQRTPFSFEHEDYWGFIAELAASEGENGNLPARSIFKTLSDRRKFTHDFLKNHNQDPLTWSDVKGEDEVAWSPDDHPRFYVTQSIPQDIVDQVLSGELELDRGQLAEVLALRPKETWVVPANVAQTLNQLSAPREDNVFGSMLRRLNTIWKQWVLLNPKRALKYNINNMSGDLDIVMAYDWRIAIGLRKAWRDLRAYMGTKDMDPATRRELDLFFQRGVGTSNMTNQEIDRLATDAKSQIPGMGDHNLLVKFWEGVRKYTTLRENLLRLAAYRYFKEKLAAGKKPLGASRASEVNRLYEEIGKGRYTQDELAAKLARELLGDYGNISPGGAYLRRKMVPFYSWIEINAPRYYFLFQNAALDDSGGSKVGTVGSLVFKGAKGVTGATISVQAFSLLIMAINYAAGNGDDMEDIFRTRRQLHLILGHDDEGNVQSIRMQGAWSDALEWFGLSDLPADVREFQEDGPEVLEEKALDVLKAPINRMYRGLSPFYKTAFETLIGYKAYPDLLRSSDKMFDLGYTPVRSRGLEAARMWSAEDLYLRAWDGLHKVGVAKKPAPPAYDAENVALSLLLYRTDPGQQAYWEARIGASKWAEKNLNKTRGAFSVTETGNALYWFRKSLQMGQEEKAQEHLRHYMELRAKTGANLDGILKGIATSVANQHPLNDIPKANRLLYVATLNQRQQDELLLALNWYAKIYGVSADDL